MRRDKTLRKQMVASIEAERRAHKLLSLPGRPRRVQAAEVRPGDLVGEERGFEEMVVSVKPEIWGAFRGKKLGRVKICTRSARVIPGFRNIKSCGTYELNEKVYIRR